MSEQHSLAITLGELASVTGAELRGDPNLVISGIASLAEASNTQLAFVARKSLLDQVPDCQAAALMVSKGLADQVSTSGPLLLADDAYLGYAQISRLFDPYYQARATTVHPSAAIAEDVDLAEQVEVGPGVVIESGVRIGSGTIIGAGCFIGRGSRIGASGVLHANVTVYHGVIIGDHCCVQSGTVIGSDGFGYAPSAQGWQKIHQIGGVVIGDRVEVGSNTSIDRGALGDTRIATGVIIDNLVHIAHNVSIGENTAIAGCCGFAGSVTVGANCTFAGQVGVTGHIHICDNAHFLGKAMVTNSVTEPGTYASGAPVEPAKKWRKNAVRFTQLDELARTVSKLARKIGQ